MRLRLPLYGQLLLWLSLNLALIVVLIFTLPGHGVLGWNALLTDSVRSRLLAIGRDIGAELSTADHPAWPTLLAETGHRYGVRLEINEGPGHGPELGPPHDRPFTGDGPSPGSGSDDFAGPAPGLHASGPPSPLTDLIHLQSIRALGPFEIDIPAPLSTPFDHRRLIELRATVDGAGELLHFLGIAEWLRLLALIFTASALLWLPFIGGITRAVRRLTDTTQRIADGALDTRVALARKDELGVLAESVNRMAARIEDHVSTQRQFIADIAHEVTSPLARLQMALALLEARIPADAHAAFEDAHEEVTQMAALLDELLLFSRAELASHRVESEPVQIDALVTRVLAAEDVGRRIVTRLPAGLSVRVPAALLERALANLARNALRHAGTQAAIEIAAESSDDRLLLTVRDRGPGVPAEALARLGKPFYRPDAARSRNLGGYGLGLAIAHRCAAACGGRLRLRNRVGGGFEAELTLPNGDLAGT